ncbi:MAG: alpha/beta fold hydrolase [Pyrinomonadaceae bacterium]
MFEIDFTFDEPFRLENGVEIRPLDLRCSIYGKLNADRSNAVLVFHALTGSSRIAEWWKDILGTRLGLDTSKYAFVCVNYLGSCYGSTSAAVLSKRNGSWKKKLPVVTTRDIVKTNFRLLEYLGIKKLKALVGGSVGGMLALQFAADHPEVAEKCVAIGASPLSSMGLALNHLQRQALRLNDIEMARKIAMISYKSAGFFDERFARNPNRNGELPEEDHENRFDVAGYLDYQGDIFNQRFENESYQLITKVMDLFELSDDEIGRIKARVSLIGISSDWLFPAKDIERFNDKLRSLGVDSRFITFESNDGHDAFLSDTEKMNEILKGVLSDRLEATGGI